MGNHTAKKELIDLFLPILEKFKLELQTKYPTFVIRAGESSSSIGSLTNYQAHMVYVECYRLSNIKDEPNCLSSEITVRALNTNKPMLCILDVGWGGDGVPPEPEDLYLLNEEIPWGNVAIKKIENSLAELKNHFDLCINAWQQKYPLET
jgi:hypothetical protein